MRPQGAPFEAVAASWTIGNLAVAEAAGHQRRDLPLPAGEPGRSADAPGILALFIEAKLDRLADGASRRARRLTSDGNLILLRHRLEVALHSVRAVGHPVRHLECLRIVR